MIKYTDTLDLHADVDPAHDEHVSLIPAHLVCGTEVEVEWEDHEWEETETMIHDISQSVAYALRMSL